MDWFQQVNDHVAVGKYYYSVLSPCGWQELEKKKEEKNVASENCISLKLIP